MRQAAVISLVLALAGMWMEPHLTAAGAQPPPTPPTYPEGNSVAPDPVSDPLATPGTPAANLGKATARPATQPAAWKQVRGADGYWRIAQGRDGVWWFLSPDNKSEFLNTVTTVQPYQLARDREGPAFISSDYDGGLAQNGNLDAWATATLERVRAAGFKGLGAWSHPVFHKLDVPMTRDLNVWSWAHGPARRVYSPQFAELVDKAIKDQVAPLRDNRNLVGYFLDNEVDWSDVSCGPGAYFDYLPPQDPNRLEVIKVIRKVWADVAQFNADWQTKAASFQDLERWNALPRTQPQPYARLFSAWLSHLAEDYFRITTAAVRKYDPNHLILGVRYKGWALVEVVRASKNYTDVQSINYYPGDARLDREMFRMLHELSGQPVMLSEYSFHALDGRSGNRNTVGFNAQVLDQQARADGYRLMTTRLARVPYVIGADWFQWNDEPPSGRANDGEDANFGIVDIDDKPYARLMEAVKTTAPTLNTLHAASHKDPGHDIWRESFAEKPVHRAPFLAKPVRINGELSDWPPEAKVQGVRHSPTVGLERSGIPVPNVYLGWREEGLYLAAEVFDNDIHGAPPQGWWWTRDVVEFWISTKPVASDQVAYDKHCHQFFFVPNSFPAENGVAGVVGQYHRDGDALKESLIPHPQVRQICRIFPGKYVFETFIPAPALHGFDPKTQPALAFNIHVRDFQHALDYFWSAPKDVLTQLRPNTWGPVYLEPAGTKLTAPAEARATPARRHAATMPTASAE